MTDDPGETRPDDILDGNAAAGPLARGVRCGHDDRPREVRALRRRARGRRAACLQPCPGNGAAMPGL